MLALMLAELAGFAEDFFVGDGPGDRGDGNGEYKQPDDLLGHGHRLFGAARMGRFGPGVS